MTNDASAAQSRTQSRRKSSFSLAGLLGVLTICAVLSAWLVDHRKLIEQISPPQQKLGAVYPLSHASADLASQKLNELFESDRILPDPDSNSVIVVAEQIDHDRIRMILHQIDRQDSEFVDSRMPVHKPKNETLKINTN